MKKEHTHKNIVRPATRLAGYTLKNRVGPTPGKIVQLPLYPAQTPALMKGVKVMPVLLMEDWKRNAHTAHRIPPYLSFPQHRTMLVTQQKAFFGFYFCIEHTHTHTIFLPRCSCLAVMSTRSETI